MMRKLCLGLLLFLCCGASFASTPITCTQLTALGYAYLYFGFTGTSTNLFTIAGSNDSVHWTNIGGTWPTCGNGSPCLVNAPSAVCYNDHLYLLMAEANDSNYNSTYQDIGILNTDYSVTTLATFSWASLGSVQTIFAGNWKRVAGYTNCFDTPVTFATGYDLFSTYTACASLTPTSVSITSGPTLLTTSGITMGYDPQVIQQGSTCNLIQSQTNSGNTVTASAISTGACPNGPFTFQSNALQSGSPLQNQTSGRNEGPNYLQTNIAGGWYFFYENLASHQMYFANCTPIVIMSCGITPSAWVEDQTYRHGSVLRITTTPLPTTTVAGATLQGVVMQ
jgi:hypothetical protein